MSLHDVFIYPLEVFLKFLFELSYSHTSNYLASAVFMSLLVTIILIPFFYWAEIVQRREQKISSKLKPSLDEFKRVYKGQELQSVIRTLYKQNHYHPLYSLRSLASLAIQIPFFIAAYSMLADYEPLKGVSSFLFSDLSKPDGWISLVGDFSLNIMPFIMTGINILAVQLYSKETSAKERGQLYFISLIFLILLYNSPSLLLFYWTLNNILTVLRIYLINWLLNGKSYTRDDEPEAVSKLYVKSLLNIFLIVFLFSPLGIMSSSPEEFDGAFKIIGTLFYLFLLLFLLFKQLAYVKVDAFQGFLGGTALFFVLYFTTNLFLFQTDYGPMDFFIFHETDKLKPHKLWPLYDGLPIFILGGISWYIMKNVTLSRCLKVLNLSALAFAFSIIFSVYTILSFDYDSDATVSAKAKGKESVTDQKHFHFSKHGKNVLVIFFDRFVGGFVPDILKDLPNLKDELTGFTWYPNTVSFGNGTVIGAPAMIGGYDFVDAEAMQRDDIDWTKAQYKPNDSIVQERLIKSISFMANKFKANNFRSFIADPSYLKKRTLDRLSDDSTKMFKFRKHYSRLNVLELKEDKGITVDNSLLLSTSYLIPFSLFKVAPPSKRRLLYNKGKWWDGSSNISKWSEKYASNLGSARAWPKVSVVNKQLFGTYNFVANHLTHDTYAALDDGKFRGKLEGDSKWTDFLDPVYFPTSHIKRFKNSFSLVHFYSSKEALVRVAEWVGWLKDNGVYDNTKIIVVSDHGMNVINPMFKEQRSKDGFNYSEYNPVLMVKGIKSKGEMKSDMTFMTHADVPSIALSVVEEDSLKKYGSDKSNGFRVFTKKGNLTVKNNIFQPSNWTYTE